MPAKKREHKLDIVSAGIVKNYPFLKRVFPISDRSEITLDQLQVGHLLES